MSMDNKLSRQRTLESLKKEAKRWFDALRRNIPDAHTRFERLVPRALPKPWHYWTGISTCTRRASVSPSG